MDFQIGYKERLEQSLENLEKFKEVNVVEGVRHEIDSIEKFYKAELWNLRALK
jgi:predicted DNA-binding protein